MSIMMMIIFSVVVLALFVLGTYLGATLFRKR